MVIMEQKIALKDGKYMGFQFRLPHTKVDMAQRAVMKVLFEHRVRLTSNVGVSAVLLDNNVSALEIGPSRSRATWASTLSTCQNIALTFNYRMAIYTLPTGPDSLLEKFRSLLCLSFRRHGLCFWSHVIKYVPFEILQDRSC